MTLNLWPIKFTNTSDKFMAVSIESNQEMARQIVLPPKGVIEFAKQDSLNVTWAVL